MLWKIGNSTRFERGQENLTEEPGLGRWTEVSQEKSREWASWQGWQVYTQATWEWGARGKRECGHQQWWRLCLEKGLGQAMKNWRRPFFKEVKDWLDVYFEVMVPVAPEQTAWWGDSLMEEDRKESTAPAQANPHAGVAGVLRGPLLPTRLTVNYSRIHSATAASRGPCYARSFVLQKLQNKSTQTLRFSFLWLPRHEELEVRLLLD